MSRAARRSFARNARRDVKAWGCNCHPTITGAAREHTEAVGAVDGLLILHDRGCPLGDRAYAFNLLGIVPGDFTTTTRCTR